MTAKLANYTTTVSASKSVQEIQKMLQDHGATQILIDYDKGKPVGLSFIIPLRYGVYPFRLPIKVKNVQDCLNRNKVRRVYHPNQEEIDKNRALDVGWRTLRDWLRAQLTLIEIDQVSFAEVFFSHLRQSDGTTLYEAWESKQKLLGQGK